jgi:predicted Zn-dependent protease
MASVLERGLGGVAEIARACPIFNELVQAVAAQDADAAEKKLKQLAGMKLPRLMDAVRLMLTGTVQIQRGDCQAALGSFDQAQRLHPDMPCVELLRGVALNHLGRWDEALKRLEAYRGLLGDEALVCREMGDALCGLRRFAEACASYRKALDDEPRDAEAFVGLLRAVGLGDQRDDLGPRFLKLDNAVANFPHFAEECVARQDADALERLAEAVRASDPRSAAANYYSALGRVWLRQFDDAVKLFRAVIARETDADKRTTYVQGFLHAMARAGQGLAAYNAAPDATAAFRQLAAELKAAHHADELRRLVAAHRKQHANDPLLPFYEGLLHARVGNFALAEKSFAAGMTHPPDATTLATFRAERVLARFHTGQGLAAYNEIEPQHDTFVQLAGLCLGEDNHTLLAALLDAHAQKRPDNVEVLRFRYRLAIRQGRTADAVPHFKAALAKQKSEEDGGETLSDFLTEMREAGKMLEGYEAAPDGRAAFESLAADLLEDSHWGELARLLDAHRRRCPDDPRLPYYAAQLHTHDKVWDRAA